MANYKSELSYKDMGTILLENRIINLVGPINDTIAYQVTSALLILGEESDKPIQMFINSPGGSVMAGFAIIDTMNQINAPVYTIVTGLAASMAATILSSGEKGHRMALPNSVIMMHQTSSGTEGNIQDMRISLKFTEDLNRKALELEAKNLNKSVEQLEKDLDRDKWFFAEEALAYGIIDEIAKPTKK